MSRLTTLCRIGAAIVTLAVPVFAKAEAQHTLSSTAIGTPEIRVAEGADTPTSMPGNIARNTTTDNVLANVVESLVALRGDLSIGPMLADRWDISPDARTYTFHLRHGVLFHDGSPLTSSAVKWSFDFLMRPENGFMCRGNYDGHRGAKVVSVRTPDAYTVVFELDRANELFLKDMVDTHCPLAILSPSSVDSSGQWIRPIATGPFIFADWRRGQYILLKRFAQYRPRGEPPSGLAGAKVAHDDARFVVIPDEAAQKVAIAAGEVDMMSVSGDGFIDSDPRWRVVLGPSADPAELLMQSQDPTLADVRVRRAIALALDLPGIVNAVTDGRAHYSPSLVPETSNVFGPGDQAGFSQNIAEAKRLLAEAGYRGQTLKIETNRRFPFMFSLAIYVQSLLKKAGISTELEVVDWGKQVADFRVGHFQIMSFAYSARTDPAMMFSDVLGDKAKTPMAQWDNPEALKLLHSLRGVTDESVRRQTFEQLHKMMIADVPMIVLYDTPDLRIVSNRLEGVASWPMRRTRVFNVVKH
jgi:peptide/nickel transport system substrate-binding protein